MREILKCGDGGSGGRGSVGSGGSVQADSDFRRTCLKVR